MAQLAPLPTDDQIVAAAAELVAQARASMELHGYYVDPRPTANALAGRLGVAGARRLGNGAVKGSWSGYMSPALRLAPRLASLHRRGLLTRSYDTDDHRYIYGVRS